MVVYVRLGAVARYRPGSGAAVNAEPTSGKLKELPRLGPRPCEGCRHQRRCKDQTLGCHAFILYRRHEGPARWALAPRHPTRDLYEQAMHPPKVTTRPVYRRNFAEQLEEDFE
jgi:hypothetical protein